MTTASRIRVVVALAGIVATTSVPSRWAWPAGAALERGSRAVTPVASRDAALSELRAQNANETATPCLVRPRSGATERRALGAEPGAR